MHAVGGDPLVGDLLLQIRHLGHVHQRGVALVGRTAAAHQRTHFGGVTVGRRLHRAAAHLIGLGDVGAAGKVAGTALQRGKFDGAGLAAQLGADEVRQIPAGAA